MRHLPNIESIIDRDERTAKGRTEEEKSGFWVGPRILRVAIETMDSDDTSHQRCIRVLTHNWRYQSGVSQPIMRWMSRQMAKYRSPLERA